jgi:hypothetical protein
VHTAPNIIASVLKQLIQTRDAVSTNTKSFHKRHQRLRTSPTLVEFTGALKYEISTFSKAFIIIDALDECSEDNGTRSSLLSALRSLSGNIRVLVTSRDIPSINIEQDFFGTRRLDIRAEENDMKKYIRSRIPRNYPAELKQIVVDKVIENARGM